MYRGTTPNQLFKVNFLTNNIDKIYITYNQNNSKILEKTKENLTFNDDTINNTSIISFKMTQEESLLFTAGETVLIQVRIKFTNSDAIASNYIRTTANEILKAGVI